MKILKVVVLISFIAFLFLGGIFVYQTFIKEADTAVDDRMTLKQYQQEYDKNPNALKEQAEKTEEASSKKKKTKTSKVSEDNTKISGDNAKKK